MRIGIFLGLRDILPRLSDHVRRAQEAEADGFDSFWLAQVFGADVLTVIALAGEKTNRIELGTAVVPTFPRHPVVLAQQALTAQAATGGRLTLGVGVSHKSTIEGWLGLSYDRPASHMKEYLSVLRPLLNEEGVNFTGKEFRVNTALQVPDAMTCPVLVSALGPRMLAIAGELADIPQIEPPFLDIAPAGMLPTIISHSKGVKCVLIRSNSSFHGPTTVLPSVKSPNRLSTTKSLPWEALLPCTTR